MRVLIPLVIIVAMAGAASAQEQAPPSNPADINPQVMTVNGEPVYAAEISLVMRTIASNLRAGGKEPSDKEVLGAATQRVIEQKLLAQEARRFGLRPDETEVERMVQTATKELGGRDELAAWLARGGSSIEQLTDIYREVDLGRILIARQIKPTVQVTEQEVDDLVAKHPELFTTNGEQGGPGEPMSGEAARQRAHALLVNRKTGELVKELLKTLTGNATIAEIGQPSASTSPAHPGPPPDSSR